MIENCRLCDKKTILKESHILPKSIYRILKEITNTRELRFANKPNLIVQDGYKKYFLCSDCEYLFEQFETPFARKILHPLIDNQMQRITYESWFLKFCVSVSWRVLMLLKEECDLSHLSSAELNCIDLALRTWKDFLFGHRLHPGQYEQHFFPMGIIIGFSNPSIKLPLNINTYNHMTVDMDIIIFNNEIHTYSKLGPLFLIGQINTQTKGREWIGTKVHVKQGVVNSQPYKIPDFVSNKIFQRANALLDVQSLMSMAQIKKINDLSFNPAAYFAMQKDITLSKIPTCPVWT